MLEKYPDLLAGEQIDETYPRRWLLISREIGFPEVNDGGLRMSLDHLFLDQDGIPTLVEVKRSSDHRIRREVVGQMLDYAANAIGFWSVEFIRSRFETAVEDENQDPLDKVAEFLELIETGVEELAQEKLPELLILKYQALDDAQRKLGDVATIHSTFVDFQRYLYAS